MHRIIRFRRLACAALSTLTVGFLLAGCPTSGDPAPDATVRDTAPDDSGTDRPDADSTEGETSEPDADDAASDASLNCDADESEVEDACFSCGPAGGCADSGAACRPTCSGDDDCSGEFTNCDGEVCRRACI